MGVAVGSGSGSGPAEAAKRIGANSEDVHIFHFRTHNFFPCSGSAAADNGFAAVVAEQTPTTQLSPACPTRNRTAVVSHLETAKNNFLKKKSEPETFKNRAKSETFLFLLFSYLSEVLGERLVRVEPSAARTGIVGVSSGRG